MGRRGRAALERPRAALRHGVPSLRPTPDHRSAAGRRQHGARRRMWRRSVLTGRRRGGGRGSRARGRPVSAAGRTGSPPGRSRRLAQRRLRVRRRAGPPVPAGAFDVAISRFGAMFFADPTVAFRNIARGQRPGGRFALLAWRSLAHNEWISVIRSALAAGGHCPSRPPLHPGRSGSPTPLTSSGGWTPQAIPASSSARWPSRSRSAAKSRTRSRTCVDSGWPAD